MSKLFETMTAINKQHANAGDAGQYNFTTYKDCDKCEGFGWVIDSQDIHRDCIPCNGTGRADGKGLHYSEKRYAEEPAPTVSLYNLLDHSPEDLRRLSIAVRDQIRSIDDIKLSLADTYTSLCAWKTLIDSAIIEKHQRDSEAWAEKTAKEINETL